MTVDAPAPSATGPDTARLVGRLRQELRVDQLRDCVS